MSGQPEEKLELTASKNSAQKWGRKIAKKVIRTIGEQLLFVAPEGYVPRAKLTQRNDHESKDSIGMTNSSQSSKYSDKTSKVGKTDSQSTTRKDSVWGRIVGGKGKEAAAY